MNKFIEEYINFASEITDAPIEFHQFMGYAVISSALGRNVSFPFGDMKLFPNMYMLFIAPSSTFRKSTVLSIGANLLRKLKPDIILPSEFTQEKILEVLSSSPTGTIVFYEFLSLMSLLSKDYNSGLKSFLTELYDCPPSYSRKTKGTDVLIENPCVSIISATTQDWFIEKIKEGDLSGGFLSRFLFIPAVKKERDMPLPPPADENKKNKLLLQLKSLSSIKGTFTLCPEAKKEYEMWYTKQNAKILRLSPLISGSIARLQIYALKFAMLEALGGEKLIITEKAMLEALCYIDWITKKTEDLVENGLSFNRFGREIKKMIKLIQNYEGLGITRSELIKKMDMSSNDLDVLLTTLFDRNEIQKEVIHDGGKPITKYKWKR